MANWSELIKEIGQLGSPFDILRLKYISALAKYTRRNVICYYSGWLQKPELGIAAAVNDTDKNGLMTTINGLDVSKGLDLVLHTPGGDTAATESWTISGVSSKATFDASSHRWPCLQGQ